jgi:hypothetical protein
MNTEGWKYKYGDLVYKISGSEWEGRICGFYTTKLNEHGYNIESWCHKNSVQNYPEKALDFLSNKPKPQ